jgi:predicted phosphodiesterase
MNLHILSDLHLTVAPLTQPQNDADVVILAGDIARPRDAIAWAQAFAKPVLYVPGNHEFYGGEIDETRKTLRAASENTRVRVLDDDVFVHRGVRFVGSTLWTDFLLFGEAQRAAAMDEGRRFLRDFTRIRYGEAPYTPQDSAMRFATHRRFLERALATPFAGPTVVVTHHAPSRSSIHPRFHGSPLNACFVSDLEAMMDGTRVALWIHGHTHDSFDYTINGTRVVCNPRGYAPHGINENTRFDPDFVVAIDAPAN